MRRRQHASSRQFTRVLSEKMFQVDFCFWLLQTHCTHLSRLRSLHRRIVVDSHDLFSGPLLVQQVSPTFLSNMDKSSISDPPDFELNPLEDGNETELTRGTEQDRRDMERLGQRQQLDV